MRRTTAASSSSSVLSGFHRSTDIPTISEETTSFDENNVIET
jgi:hypothetical protein